jgi:hypothetical protein
MLQSPLKSADYNPQRGVPTLISLDFTSKSISKGEAFKFTAYPTVPGNITWSSNNTSVATVTQGGSLNEVC